MEGESSTLLPDRDKSLIPFPDYLDLELDLYEYEQSLSSKKIVGVDVDPHSVLEIYWRSQYILDVIYSGCIPFYSTPPVSFSNNSKLTRFYSRYWNPGCKGVHAFC